MSKRKMVTMPKKISDRAFYQEPTHIMAQKLLGKVLVHETHGRKRAGIIVETEAYTADDPASHAYVGKTTRNSSLFGPVGHAYVYFTYGVHWCLNIVSRDKHQIAGGVLLRALEPIEGIDIMQKARGKTKITELTSGPGKLTQALGIDKRYDGYDLVNGTELYLEYGIDVPASEIVATKRIGISVAQEVLWRFIIKGNIFVSRR